MLYIKRNAIVSFSDHTSSAKPVGHGGLKDDKKAQNAGEKTNEENVDGFPNDM